MPTYELKSGDECEVGLLRIDWDKRTWCVDGIGGHRGDLISPAEVLDVLQQPREPNTEIMAVVAWKENADGYQQLCFYEMQSFQSEVYGPIERSEPA
jgi:hypothetical protein